MENQTTEQIAISHNSDTGSLEEFKQTILGAESDLSSSVSTLSPDLSAMQRSEYTDDQFEGVFYNTLREESQISVSFVSNVFYHTFQNKFLADFANSIENDDSNRIFTCTTHVQRLKCDLKLDSVSKTVKIAGVGRIVWRKDRFPRITRAIFKQYVMISEKGNDSCEYQMGKNLACEENTVVTSTPCVEKADFQVNNIAQEPNFYCTPIVQSGQGRASDSFFSYGTPVMQRPGLQAVNSSVNMHQSAYGFMPMVPISMPPNVALNQSVFGCSSTLPPTESQINDIAVCSNTMNPAQPVFFHGEGMNQGQLSVTANEGRHTNEPLLYTNQGTDVQMLTDSAVLPQFTSSNPPPSQREMMYNTEQRSDTECFNSNPHDYQGGQFDENRNIAVSGSPEFTCRPFVPVAESHDKTEAQQCQSNYDQVMPQKSTEGVSTLVNEETLLDIIKSIKNLESLLNNMKSSVLTAVESKLQEMKTTLVSAFDNARTYAEVVKKPAIIIDSSSTDEGYFNNTTDTTSDANSSQTIPKTVYPSVSNCSTAITVTDKPTPKRIPVHVTDRDENILEKNNMVTQNRHSQPNINRNPTPSSASLSKKKTLLIGDSILNRINLRGIEKGVQKHSKSGAKASDIVEDITSYNMKSFKAIVVSVGGNDASSKTDIELFEEKYDQLISLVKTGNPECELYMCNISPRGDADVRNYNACIERLATYWEKHKVTLIKETESFFYGKDGLPTSRYFGDDGIHLSNSGIKRLLHAIESRVHIIADFDLCTYKSRGSGNGTEYGSQRLDTPPTTGGTRRPFGPSAYKRNQNNQRGWYPAQRGNNSYNGRTKRRCFACGMVGHMVKDCWNSA